MEILTLLKANIKKKKGTFISIAFLMVIISAVMTSLISVKDNYQNAVKTALKGEDACDVVMYFSEKNLTTEIRQALENSELVGDVEYENILFTDSLKREGYDNSSTRDNLATAQSSLKFYKDDLSGFESGPRTIQDGELYIPFGHKAAYKCEIGDKFTASFGDRTASRIDRTSTSGNRRSAFFQPDVSSSLRLPARRVLPAFLAPPVRSCNLQRLLKCPERMARTRSRSPALRAKAILRRS